MCMKCGIMYNAATSFFTHGRTVVRNMHHPVSAQTLGRLLHHRTNVRRVACFTRKPLYICRRKPYSRCRNRVSDHVPEHAQIEFPPNRHGNSATWACRCGCIVRSLILALAHTPTKHILQLCMKRRPCLIVFLEP